MAHFSSFVALQKYFGDLHFLEDPMCLHSTHIRAENAKPSLRGLFRVTLKHHGVAVKKK